MVADVGHGAVLHHGGHGVHGFEALGIVKCHLLFGAVENLASIGKQQRLPQPVPGDAPVEVNAARLWAGFT